jgi:hypothetical protein
MELAAVVVVLAVVAVAQMTLLAVMAALVLRQPFAGLPSILVAVAAAVTAVVAALVVLAAAAVQPPALEQALDRPILVAAVLVALWLAELSAATVVLVSWWFATALRNFSTGETHETIDFGHCSGTDPDGLRHQSGRLLQRHCCS